MLAVVISATESSANNITAKALRTDLILQLPTLHSRVCIALAWRTPTFLIDLLL